MNRIGTHCSAAQLPLRRDPVITGAQQAHHARGFWTARPAAAPTRFPLRFRLRRPRRQNVFRRSRRKRISRRKSCLASPSNAPTRGSCSGATPRFRASPECGATATAQFACRICSRHRRKTTHARAGLCDRCKHRRGKSCRHPAAFFAPLPSRVMTLPRNFATPFSAPDGIRITSSNMPLITVRNSSMLSSLSRV